MKIFRELDMAVIECCYCGTTFAIPKLMALKASKTNKQVRCPNGDKVYVTPPPKEKTTP